MVNTRGLELRREFRETYMPGIFKAEGNEYSPHYDPGDWGKFTIAGLSFRFILQMLKRDKIDWREEIKTFMTEYPKGFEKYQTILQDLGVTKGSQHYEVAMWMLSKYYARAIDIGDTYYREFYIPTQIYNMPECVREMALHIAIMKGQDDAIKPLQEISDAKVDGKIGPETIANAASMVSNLGEQLFIYRYVQECIDHSQQLVVENPDQLKYLMGWTNRYQKLGDDAMIKANRPRPDPDQAHVSLKELKEKLQWRATDISEADLAKFDAANFRPTE